MYYIFYSVVGFTVFLICALIARCNHIVNKNDEEQKFHQALVTVAAFAFVDSLWGLMASPYIPCGPVVFWIASFMFHTAALVSSYLWFRYASYVFDFKGNKVVTIVESLLFFLGVAVLVSQFFTESLFFIDENKGYHTGAHRNVLFGIECFYLIYVFIRTMIRFHRNLEIKDMSISLSVAEATIAPVITAFLQYLFPDPPFFSIGYLVMIVAMFNGAMVINSARADREESKMATRTSEETYSALESIAAGFVSLHLFDLTANKQHPVKSTPEIDYFVLPEDNGHDQIKKVMQGVVAPLYRDKLVEFVDTYTLSERMKGKRVIAAEFIGMNQGWCMSSFIKVQEDEEGNITKVIHAVQNIDEAKKRELDYTQALTRAYEDKNAIYAEILKMQTTGVIVTDETDSIIMANDRAMQMFNRTEDSAEGMEFAEFTKYSKIQNYEEASAKYDSLIPNGEGFNYRLTVFKDGRLANNRYLIAEVKCLSLLDGTTVMVTCYTDVTDNKMLEDKLRKMSETDALTRIDNRGSGEQKIQIMLEQQQEGLFCIIDVDKFKSINDTFGHKNGDLALIAVANAIRSSFRNDDIIMRLGGDEFAVYAKSVVTKELAESKFAMLFEKIEKIEIEDIPTGFISISLGAMLVLKDRQGYIREDFGSVYQKADAVMYESKGIKGNSRIFV